MHKLFSRRPLGVLAAASVLAITAACSNQDAPAEENTAPTVDDAAEFIENVETYYRDFGEYSARIAWVNATYIN